MVSSDRPIRRVVLPLEASSDERHALLPATVLANWFGVPLQLVTPDPNAVGHYVEVAGGLGVPVEPVVVLPEVDFPAELADHARRHAPSVCVTTMDERGLALARASDQATFLMGSQDTHRLATGPLVTPLTGNVHDLDAVAVAATWAHALEIPVRLVVGGDPGASERGEWAGYRLNEMGVVSDLDVAGDDPVEVGIAIASARAATALVVSVDRLGDPALLDAAVGSGISVLVAPLLTDDRRRSMSADLASADVEDEGRRATETGEHVLSADECSELLAGQPIGRLGYIDDGWPVVVPVNFSVDEGEVFIRGMAGAKLSAAERQDVVCLQVDELDSVSRSGWSVLVHGPMELITDPRVLRAAWDRDPDPWSEASDWTWLRIRPLSMTGRRHGAASGPVPGHQATSSEGAGAQT